MTNTTAETTETTETETTEMINVTEAAAAKIKELLLSENKENHGIRLSVAGGGCHGYQYGMQFEEAATDMDQVLEIEGVKFFVDPMSVPMLTGAQVDYVETVQGAGFAINNPNAQSTCGCGSSFSA